MFNLDEDSEIFEYMENLFIEMKKADGGYFPSKHDEKVFDATACKYGMTIEKVGELYSRCKNYSSGVYLKKKGRMSKQERLREMAAIMNENKESPFVIDNPETLPVLKSDLQEIFDEYILLAEKIGQNGWTIPMVMKFSDLDSAKSGTHTKKELDALFLNFYFGKSGANFKLLVKHINNSVFIGSRKELFNQCVENFYSGNYLITINCLASILEGVLSSCDSDKTNIRMMKICREQLEKVERENKQIKKLVWTSFSNFITLLYTKSEFDKAEPLNVNRHWLLHGRTSVAWEKEDCLRLFNAIYTIVSLMKFQGR